MKNINIYKIRIFIAAMLAVYSYAGIAAAQNGVESGKEISVTIDNGEISSIQFRVKDSGKVFKTISYQEIESENPFYQLSYRYEKVGDYWRYYNIKDEQESEKKVWLDKTQLDKKAENLNLVSLHVGRPYIEFNTSRMAVSYSVYLENELQEIVGVYAEVYIYNASGEIERIIKDGYGAEMMDLSDDGRFFLKKYGFGFQEGSDLEARGLFFYDLSDGHLIRHFTTEELRFICQWSEPVVVGSIFYWIDRDRDDTFLVFFDVEKSKIYETSIPHSEIPQVPKVIKEGFQLNSGKWIYFDQPGIINRSF